MNKLQNKHMQDEWDKEMDAIRQSVLSGENVLSTHILEQMNKRDISIQEIAVALLNGHIVEGFDIGDYPDYRNSDLFRTVLYEKEKEYLAIGVAIEYEGSDVKLKKLTTVYYERNIQVRRYYA